MYVLFNLTLSREHHCAITNVCTPQENETLEHHRMLQVLYSGLVFFLIERKVQDRMNLGNATYWGVQTITALGYGDVVPTTSGSKVLACFVSLLGIVVLAIPTGIVSSTFIDLSNEERRRNRQNTSESIGKLNHDVELLSSEIKALCEKVDGFVVLSDSPPPVSSSSLCRDDDDGTSQ